MNALALHPIVRSIAWALLHFLWQGALLAALFATTRALTSESQAKLRYAIGCVAMFLMPLVFAATILRTSSSHDIPNLPTIAITNAPTATAVPAHSDSPQTIQSPNAFENLPAIAVLLWLTGIAAFSISTFIGWRRVHRLRTHGVETAPRPLQETMDRLKQRLRVATPVRLVISAVAEVPAVIGWLRPYILLPISTLTGLGESELQAILAHELAHIKRYDYLVNLLQNAIETLLFYHPAVWWLSNRIREERERCCDDLAVTLCGDPILYAEALTRLEETRSNIPEPALAASGGDLLARIRRLTRTPENPHRRLTPSSLGSLAAAACVIAIAAIPTLHAQSLKFEAATIKPVGPPPHYNGLNIKPGGRLIYPTTTVKGLIITAFNVGYWQLEGGEPWMEKEEYDLEAQPSEEWRARITDLRHTLFTIDDEHLREMLQSLLIDRFQLRVHRETITGKVYLLKQKNEKNGTVGMQPTRPIEEDGVDPKNPGFGSIGFAGGRWVFTNTSMQQIAKFASDHVVHAPVVDQTGLSGSFNYKFRAPFEDDAGIDYSNPPFDLLLNGIGLKLESSTGPIEKLVIDHAERPTPN